MIEVNHQINAVDRTVGRRKLGEGEARTITITRTYRAAIEDLWDACTNPERIPRWFLPVSGELRLGGRYQLEGNASGTIERCDPPHGFTATWEFGGRVTWIELRLSTTSQDTTRFELEHIVAVDDPHWAEFGPAAMGIGWDMGLMGLEEHLRTGESSDPEAAARWLALNGIPPTPEFVALSGEAWRAADVRGGADPAGADDAARLTVAFYTGNPSGV